MFFYHRLIVLIFLLGPGSLLFSQKLIWGDEVKAGVKFLSPGVLGTMNERIYLYQQTEPQDAGDDIKAYISYFDKELKLVKGKMIPIKGITRKRVYLGIRLKEEGIFVFLAIKEPDSKEINIIAEIYDLETLELAEKRNLKSFYSKKMPRVWDFDIFSSRKHPYICIVWYNQLDRRQLDYEVFFQVYDQHMNMVWEKSIERFRPGQAFEVQNFHLSDNGDVLIGGFLYQGEIKNKLTPTNSPNYIYQGIAYRKEGQDSTLFSIDLGEKFIHDAICLKTSTGKILCGGFYNEVDPREVWKQIYLGTFFTIVDSQRIEQVAKTADFEAITRYNEKGEVSIVNKNVGYSGYRISRLIYTNEGQIHLIIKKGAPVTSIFTFDEQAERTGALLFSHEKQYYVKTFVKQGAIYLIYNNKVGRSKGLKSGNWGTFIRKVEDQGTSLADLAPAPQPASDQKTVTMPALKYQLSKDTWVVTRSINYSTHQIGLLQLPIP